MRRVLFDENLPRLLRRELPEFHVRTPRLQLDVLERALEQIREAVQGVTAGEIIRVTVPPSGTRST